MNSKLKTFLGWVFFIPVGIVSTAIIQFLFRFANIEFPFIAESLARAVEPWAFYLPALALLPKFHKTFLLISGALYTVLQVYSIYSYHFVQGFSNEPWAESFLSLVALASCLFSIIYILDKVIDHPQPERINQPSSN